MFGELRGGAVGAFWGLQLRNEEINGKKYLKCQEMAMAMGDGRLAILLLPGCYRPEDHYENCRGQESFQNNSNQLRAGNASAKTKT